MIQDTTPCHRRDEWTRESNLAGSSGESKPLHQQREDQDATLRSRLLCFAACPVRRDCLKADLDRPGAHLNSDRPAARFYVYGGYTGRERELLEAGTLTVPADAIRKNPAEPEVALAFCEGESSEEIAARLGRTRKQVFARLQATLWWLRLKHGDADLVAGLSDLGNSRHSVRAA